MAGLTPDAGPKIHTWLMTREIYFLSTPLKSITLHHSPPQSHEQSHDTTTQHAGEERPIAQLSCHSTFIGTLMQRALYGATFTRQCGPIPPPAQALSKAQGLLVRHDGQQRRRFGGIPTALLLPVVFSGLVAALRQDGLFQNK
jgi:hypothetical protein